MPHFFEFPPEPTLDQALQQLLGSTAAVVVQRTLPLCRKQTIDQAMISLQRSIGPTGIPFTEQDAQKLRALLEKHAAELSLRFDTSL